MHSIAIPELDKSGLRRFGITTGGIIAVLFGLLFPWLFDHSWPLWPWIVFLVLAAWGLLAPLTLKPVYRGWMRVGMFLGRITTPAILTIIFAFVIVPAALIMRLAGKDPMRREFDSSESYRVQSATPLHKNLENPY